MTRTGPTPASAELRGLRRVGGIVAPRTPRENVMYRADLRGVPAMAGSAHGHPRFPSWLAFALTRRKRRREYPPESIAERIGVRPGDVVMDFGCGPGFFTEAFAAKANRVVAVDAQPAMLRKARKRLGPAASRVDFVVTEDGTTLAVASASVDLVFLAYVFHELGEPGRVLRELARTMRPGARVVIMERTEHGRGLHNPPQVDPDSVDREVAAAGLEPRERIRWLQSTLLVYGKGMG